MFETNHKRKGLIGTILVHAIMIVIFIFFGMKYQDPPPEQGIAIVFGFDEQGMGDFKPVPKVASNVEPQKKIEEVVETPVEEVAPDVSEDTEEEMMTQDSEESPISAAEKKKKIQEDKLAKEKRIAEEKIAKEKRDKERDDKIKKEKLQAERDAKKAKLDGMFSGLKTSEDATGTDASQGDDGVPGYKGSEDGIKGAKSFTGNGGVGDYGNYQLGNRKPKTTPDPVYEGTEEGIVVVRISVDKTGRVIDAEAGVKGSNTTDLQLLKRAKEAALKTLWQSDDTAPEIQKGRIIYNFIIEN